MVELKNSTEVTEDTEIRHLDGIDTNELALILDQNFSWKKLMSEIRMNMFDLDDETLKYTPDEIKIIENAGRNTSRSCTHIFFEEWGTSGKKRPTVKLLRDYLEKYGLWRAADHITTKILRQPAPDRSMFPYEIYSAPTDSEPNTSLSHTLYYPSTERCENTRNGKNNLKEVSTINRKVDEILRDYKQVKQIPFAEVKIATNNFEDSCKLGIGGYGKVYFGTINNERLAVKLLNDFTIEHFEDELAILSQPVNHPKLLPPVAVSVSHSALCLLYPFMPNGSLEDRLALKTENAPPLPWQKRILISYDIIEGIEYLHNLPKQIIHRDIKPSNILLDSSDTAKIGDFGSVRTKSWTNTTSATTTIKGTEGYMAPESYLGEISIKTDIFSYGLVTLGLITGLPLQVKTKLTGNYEHLRSVVNNHFAENESIDGLLDANAGSWDLEIVNKLYFLARDCHSLDSKSRPNSTQVKNEIKDLVERIGSSS